MLSIDTTAPGAIKHALTVAGWLPEGEEVRAAGHLRQGRTPSMAAMLTGAALVEVLRPRRSKLLPRHFTLVATDRRVVAFKSWGGSGEDAGSPYKLRVHRAEAGAWPRDEVGLHDLGEDGPRAKGGLLTIGDVAVPVFRPNLNGDPSTDELLAVLSGAAVAHV